MFYLFYLGFLVNDHAGSVCHTVGSFIFYVRTGAGARAS